MLPPALIQRVAQQIERDSRAGLATLATPIESLAEFLDPNVVKVVLGQRERALYFSRAPIPWNRDGAPDGRQSRHDGALRHLGIYAYRVCGSAAACQHEADGIGTEREARAVAGTRERNRHCRRGDD